MELALKQYQTMIEQRKWRVGNSKQRKQIMNLTAQIETLRKRKFEQETSSKDTKKPTSSDKPFVSAQEWRKLRYDQAPEWMKQEAGDRSQMLVRGKTQVRLVPAPSTMAEACIK
jgi:hypothetical protein